MLRQTLNIFIVLLIITSTSIAQSFDASVDRSTVGQNERFQVYFAFSGEDINSVRSFNAPSFRNFQVLSGPNQSSSMQIINGKVTGSLTYSFIVQAPQIGKFVIGSASVEYRGKKYTTEPVNIEVVKGTPKQTQQQTGNGTSDAELAENVFIVATADKNHIVKGEQVTVTYKLYTRLNINSPQINKLPSYGGFWNEDLEISNTINFNIEMYKGERFRAATIKKVALFPTKSGDLTISPFELKVPVLVRKRKERKDIFDDFFNDSFFGRTETVEYISKSNSLKIKVDPLPIQNQPASFSGAVGNFNFSSSIDKREVDVNEGITIKLSVSGQGNIKLLDVPKLVPPPGFETYDPKILESINRKGIISGSKNIEYLIVPRIPGVKEIPPIEFSYYDVSRKKYITEKTQPFSITVREGTGGYETNVSGYSKEDVKLLSEDIRFIKTSSFNLRRKVETTIFGLWFIAGIFIPLFVLVGGVMLKRRQDKLHGNVRLLRYQKAEKAARKRLKISQKALANDESTKFYNELSKALYGYLEDKLNIQTSDFSIDRALMVLSAREIPAQLIDNVKSISERCEFARFAPDNQIDTAASELYELAVKTIVDLESALIKKRK